jgi:predicted nucleotidyltransferase
MASGLLQERRSFSEERLGLFRQDVGEILELSNQPELSIYVTGSYGRLEARSGSDLDLFFVLGGDRSIERTTKILIDAELIRIVKELKFPPFSNDAQYLEIHNLKEMIEKLGGAEDDFKNFFTARMLLLLESRPVFGDAAYKAILKQIIDAYFRDFHDHTGDFRPLFLVNDVLRFWKTLCLNYENRRNRLQDRANKNKHHLKNLKLKFSRLLICFSTIIPLFASRTNSPEEVLTLTSVPPLERLASVIKTGDQRRLYDRIIELYAFFLELSARPDILDWIGERGNRRAAFPQADEFGTTIFSLLRATMRSADDMRFLII